MNEDLRRKAEQAVARERSQEELVTGGSRDSERLIHDLQVHQVELEMQNEELREAQLTVERSRKEYADLYEHAPVGYLTVDRVAVIQRHNEAFASLVGLPETALTGRRVTDFMEPTSAEAFRSRFNAFLAAPRGKQIESLVIAPDGQERYLQLTGRIGGEINTTESRDDDEPLLHLAAMDVTERKMAEEQAGELAEQKELLLKELRHRSKNNYQLIMSMLSLQAGNSEEESVIAALEQAQSRVRTMLLVQESLSESTNSSRVAVDRYLETLLPTILTVLDPTDSVTVTTRFDPVEIEPAVADALGIILNETLTNAFKYAFSNVDNGELLVSLAYEEEILKLTVRDNGPGLPADRKKGGLGLSLVEALAQQLGGTSSTTSDERGTTVTVTASP